MYAKIINNNLQLAPNHVTIDGKNIWNAPEDIMLSLGWKKVVFTDVPDAPEGYHYESRWEEDATQITEEWELVKDPDDVDAEEALAILLGGDEG